jgi:tRNA(Arg) A34 adenosine deaminase TadA
MRLAIELARENAARGTGGPFGAAVFERRSGRLVAVGVNLVLASGCSHAHAEMIALALAQRARGSWSLAAAGAPALELVTSSEPCAMCFGAIPWSGVAALVCGARAADARAIGFDEGPKPARWVDALERRGVAVRRDVLRREARRVLRDYAAGGGPVYVPRPSHREPGGRAWSSTNRRAAPFLDVEARPLSRRRLAGGRHSERSSGRWTGRIRPSCATDATRTPSRR